MRNAKGGGEVVSRRIERRKESSPLHLAWRSSVLAYSQIQAPCGLKVAPETHLFLVGYDREFLGMKPHGSIVAPTTPEPLLIEGYTQWSISLDPVGVYRTTGV